jgi:hypothetical protein
MTDRLDRRAAARAHLRLVVTEPDVEIILPVSQAAFQELIRVAFAQPGMTVPDVITQFIADGLAAWPERIAQLLAEPPRTRAVADGDAR